MAFGINREELAAWKSAVRQEKIAFLTHYWLDDRFPSCKTVTKVGCANVEKLVKWGQQYGLKREWIDMRNDYPHFDLVGDYEKEILSKEGLISQLERFDVRPSH
ncbi:conserved protein yneq [Bacillus sp. OxB-1]|uniref:hypothetical protein n=1 Tax=Bacillus sp. (strain OxB-1) TaxID=98228 RepID=UPI000581D96C|nr:hypothetical protein [Bacillus sp. OxB-1]BAQ11088.1 conserved protein yneq [Bacillus sp. OxB-1]